MSAVAPLLGQWWDNLQSRTRSCAIVGVEPGEHGMDLVLVAVGDTGQVFRTRPSSVAIVGGLPADWRVGQLGYSRHASTPQDEALARGEV